MKKPPITHLIVDTTSSNENDNGDCDYCLIPMTVGYISYLLAYMDEVRRLHRADNAVNALECWDGSPECFQDNDRLGELRDVDGELAADIQQGEPILLTADPKFSEGDFQRVECQSVQVLSEDVWWTAYVRHTSIRIETARVEKKTLLRIFRSLGGTRDRRGQAKERPIPPVARRVHDLLYLDMKNGRQFYNPDKGWDSDTMAAIAEIVAEFIPRPPQIES